jgi:hypothetical protein
MDRARCGAVVTAGVISTGRHTTTTQPNRFLNGYRPIPDAGPAVVRHRAVTANAVTPVICIIGGAANAPT